MPAYLRRYFLKKINVFSWDVRDFQGVVLLESHNFDTMELISSQEIIERIKHGEIVVIRRCLQNIAMHDTVVAEILRALMIVCNEGAVSYVKKHGIEKIHEVLPAKSLSKFYEETEKVIPELALNIMARFNFFTLARRTPFYVETGPNIRMMYPYDVMSRELVSLRHLAKTIGRGKVTLHGPHQDSWFFHAFNTVNLWCAIGHVSEFNGLTFYPTMWGKQLACNEKQEIDPHYHLGRGITFNLEPGDVLLFMADQIHASTINQTDKTRLIISMRMTFEKPDYYKNFCYYDFRRVKFFSHNHRMKAKVQRFPHPRFFLARSKGFKRGIIPPATEIPLSKNQYLKTRSGNDPSIIVFRSTDLVHNETRPLSDSICVARYDDRVMAFNRFCPHEGADLATGIIKDSTILCPWHGLRFDSTTGKSLCQSIKPLTFFKCHENGEWIEVHTQRGGV